MHVVPPFTGRGPHFPTGTYKTDLKSFQNICCIIVLHYCRVTSITIADKPAQQHHVVDRGDDQCNELTVHRRKYAMKVPLQRIQ